MKWRGRIIFALLFTLFGAGTWAAQPYWDSVMRPEHTTRGQLARKQRAEDTAADAWGRAALGGAVGLVAGALPFTVRGRHRPAG